MHDMEPSAHGVLLCIFGITLAISLIALAWVDIKHLILPNFLNVFLGIVGLIQSLVLADLHPIDAALGALLGSVLLGALAAGFRRLRGYSGLGMGDVKLAGAAGFWIGWQGIPLMLLSASLTALTFVSARSVWDQEFDPRWRLPFGPFLGGGTLLSWVLMVAT